MLVSKELKSKFYSYCMCEKYPRLWVNNHEALSKYKVGQEEEERKTLQTTYVILLADCLFSEFPWLEGYWGVWGQRLEMEPGGPVVLALQDTPRTPQELQLCYVAGCAAGPWKGIHSQLKFFIFSKSTP